MRQKFPNLFAISIALAACFIWAGNFVIARGVNELIPPISLAFWRWVVAFFALLPFAYAPLKREWHLVLKYWKFTIIMGVVGIAGFNTLVYIAAHYTTAHHIALISSTAPIGTLLIAGVVGIEMLSCNKILGAASALIGALVILSHGELGTITNFVWNKGDLILILTASIWAAWGAAIHYKPKEMSARVFLISQIFVGVVFLIPFYLWENYAVAPAVFTFQAWITYLYIGIGASVIGWLAWQESVRIIGPVKTSLVYYTIPAFSSILAVLTLDESFQLYHFVGFVFIVIGILVSNINKLRNMK